MTGIAVLFLLASSAHQTQVPYCEVIVNVEDTSGRKAEASVVARREDGTLEQRFQTRDGVARICDVGFEAFSLEVARGSNCPTVMMNKLKYRFLYPLELRVVVPACPDDPMIAPSFCAVIVRIRDDKGRIPEGGKLTGLPNKSSAVPLGILGRTVFTMSYGQEVGITAEAPGYLPVKETVKCERGSPYTERTLRLVGN